MEKEPYISEETLEKAGEIYDQGKRPLRMRITADKGGGRIELTDQTTWLGEED